MTTEFNKDFYAARSQELIQLVTKGGGCTNCGKMDDDDLIKLKRCTGCALVRYCNKDCQKAHWSTHKPTCKNIRLAKENPSYLPRFLAGLGYMSEEALLEEMEHYSDLFVNEVIRVGRRSQFPEPNSINVGLTVLCAEDDNNTVRLTATARFGTADDEIHDVHAVLFKTIDQGKEAIAQLYPPDDGGGMFAMFSAPPGEIAEDKKELAVKCIVEFIDRLKEKDIRVRTMTCGRGLSWLDKNSDLYDRGVMCMPG